MASADGVVVSPAAWRKPSSSTVISSRRNWNCARPGAGATTPRKVRLAITWSCPRWASAPPRRTVMVSRDSWGAICSTRMPGCCHAGADVAEMAAGAAGAGAWAGAGGKGVQAASTAQASRKVVRTADDRRWFWLGMGREEGRGDGRIVRDRRGGARAMLALRHKAVIWRCYDAVVGTQHALRTSLRSGSDRMQA